MPRPPVTQDDRVAQEHISSAMAVVEERLDFSALEMIGRLIGKITTADIRSGLRPGATAATGAFYRRWKNVGEFQEEITRRMIDSAFSIRRMDPILRAGVIPVLQARTSPVDMIQRATEGAATAAANDGPYAQIRYTTYPYVEGLGINRGETVELASALLSVIYHATSNDTPSNEELLAQTDAFLLGIDIRALQLQQEVSSK